MEDVIIELLDSENGEEALEMLFLSLGLGLKHSQFTLL
jgi:hypothetical protein